MTLRPFLAVLVLVLLARVARVSWHHRGVSVAVWRAIRPRHLIGAPLLLVVVAGTAWLLMTAVPGAHIGLGDVFGTGANAVFAPLEEGLARTSPAPASGTDWALLLGASAFLFALASLLPWLAFVEEELFRAGLEDASWSRVVGGSVVFGLVHLVMLIPIGAGIAISLAGFAYAVTYRRGHRGAWRSDLPPPALHAFRATRRSRAAADRARAAHARADGTPPGGRPASIAPVDLIDRSPELAQAAGVFAATVWHTTFNTLVVLSVWVSIVVAAVAPP